MLFSYVILAQEQTQEHENSRKTVVVGLEHVYVSEHTTFVISEQNEVKSEETLSRPSEKIAIKSVEKAHEKPKKKKKELIEQQEVKVAKQVISIQLTSEETKKLEQGWEKTKTLFSNPTQTLSIVTSSWKYKAAQFAARNFQTVSSTIHPIFYSKFITNDIYSRPPPVNTFYSIFFQKTIQISKHST